MNATHYIEHAIAAGDFEEAETALKLVPPETAHCRLWTAVAWARFAQERFSQACEAFERAAWLAPLSLSDQARLAYCYVRTRKRDVAQTIIEFLADQVQELDLAEWELLTNSALRMGSLEILACVSREGRRRFANCGLAWFAGGVVAREQDCVEVAELYFSKAVELTPDDISYRIALCQQQIRAGDASAGRATLDVEVSAVDCLANLQRIKWLFFELDDEEGVFACQAELDRWYYRDSSDG